MKRLVRWVVVVALLGLGASSASCGASDGTSDVTAPLDLVSSPEFVNRLVPGRRPLALVAGPSGSAGEPILWQATASLEGASVEIVPSSTEGDAVAEAWLHVPDVVGESAVTVTVTGRRGDREGTIVVNATVVPGVDDLEPVALDIAELFLRGLDGRVEGLPGERSALALGTPVAGLLVVSHYAWFTDEFEIGLAWHIMVAPDDWAELYLRPRSELVPTRAFRVSSWSTALTGGPYEVVEVPAPSEVTR